MWRQMALAAFIAATIFVNVDVQAERPARRMVTWAVLGPFAHDGAGYGLAAVLDEVTLRPVLGASAAGETWRYFDDRVYCRNYDDYNDLYTYFMRDEEAAGGENTANKLAYCGAYVWSPQSQNVFLRFSANDQAKVWLNSALVLEQPDVIQAMRDTQMEPVRLEEGWNAFLVKVVNVRRIWGFYFNLTDEAGAPLAGLEFSPDVPDVSGLDIVTPSLPTGYNNQPYVWLDVRNPSGAHPWDNPSASAFRFLAKGGQPPYRWRVAGLPGGLVFEEMEGEVRGRTSEAGNHTLDVTVSDSTDQTTTKSFDLDIAPRPTEEWWESSSRLGSLRHHGEPSPTFWTFDHVEEQLDYMTRSGFSWLAYTVFSKWEWGPNGEMQFESSPEMLAYRDAVRAAGIRFGQYMSFKDGREFAPDYKTHAENMHEALERLMRQNEPALWWFDEMYSHQFRPEDQETVEFDALYSLVRALDPSCLITINGDTRARDYECGDLDILQVHGAFKTDSYWGYWPPSPLFHNNPKFMPVDSWKLPWHGYMDAGEWCKTIVTMLAEPANLEAPRSIEIDPTPFLEPDYNTVELHRAIADWMEPRKESILGTFPLPLPRADWGYAVRQPATGDIYLHILSNPFGKHGIFERSYIDIAPIEARIGEATLFPSGESVAFTQEGDLLTIDVRELTIDPVDTIIRLTAQ